jgi:hypothetical protein
MTRENGLPGNWAGAAAAEWPEIVRKHQSSLVFLFQSKPAASIPRIKGACTIFPRRLSHELLGAASVMLTIATAAQAAVISVDGVSQLCGNVRGNWR